MWCCNKGSICGISKKEKSKWERTALLYVVRLYCLIPGIIFPAARMCPCCFLFLTLCLKVVSGFFSQQKQNSAEKEYCKIGPHDLKWSKELLRSLSPEFRFFFFLRDFILFKGQSPKICLQRFSRGSSVSHSHPRKGQKPLPVPPFLLRSPLVELLLHWEMSCPRLEGGSSHLFCNGNWR